MLSELIHARCVGSNRSIKTDCTGLEGARRAGLEGLKKTWREPR